MFTYSENRTKLLEQLNKQKETYKILTRDEELELIETYRNTNIAKLKNLLICHNIYLAISFSNKYAHTSNDYDALLQDAFYGLSIAAERFDFDAGVKFSAYAYIWIKKYALSSYYERHNLHIGLNSISLDMNVLNTDDSKNTMLQDILDVEDNAEASEYDKYLNCLSAANEYERKDTDDTFGKYYDQIVRMVETSADISTEEKQIFKHLFVYGKTLKIVAEQLNKPIQNIRYKRQKVLLYLKQKLSKDMSVDTTLFVSLE